VKRIHEYKRQHLNVLHVIALWQRLRREKKAKAPARDRASRGKAAPGYRMAKLMIKLVHSVAEVVNADPVTARPPPGRLHPRLQREELHAHLPAAELSEQISTAGKRPPEPAT